MSILGGPLLEENEVEDLLRKYPRFKGALPPEARLWTEAELETFLASNGSRKPTDLSENGEKKPPVNCGLLTKARLKLAEFKVEEATLEYLSYCKHRQQRSNFCTLPQIASCSPVPRVRAAPTVSHVSNGYAGEREPSLRNATPVTLVPKRGQEPVWRHWNLNFWKEACGLEYCNCRTRWPAFEQDDSGMDGICIEAGLVEYLEYMLVVEIQDAACMEDQALAFPRLQVGDFCPFVSSCSRFFKDHWHTWTPPGVEDLTHRWCEFYGSIFEQDPIHQLAQFYRLHFGVIGAVSRLHRINHQAQEWMLQMEGQRLVFLFPPEDTENIYELVGGLDEHRSDGSFGYATHISEVNLFFPSTPTGTERHVHHRSAQIVDAHHAYGGGALPTKAASGAEGGDTGIEGSASDHAQLPKVQLRGGPGVPRNPFRLGLSCVQHVEGCWSPGQPRSGSNVELRLASAHGTLLAGAYLS